MTRSESIAAALVECVECACAIPKSKALPCGHPDCKARLCGPACYRKHLDAKHDTHVLIAPSK